MAQPAATNEEVEEGAEDASSAKGGKKGLIIGLLT